MTLRLRLASALIMIAFFSGCARVGMGTLDLVTTRELSEQDFNGSLASKGRFSGKDTTRIYTFIPAGHPNIEEAVDRALEGRGKLLKDARVRYAFWYIPFIYGEESIEVDGEVWA